MNSVESNNQVEYTEDEKRLAEKFKVTPRVVRLNPEYYSEQAEGIRKAESEEVEGTETELSETDLNQNTYTDEETSLAEKFKVEPKLVRLLDELIEVRLAAPKQTTAQPQATEPVDAEAGPNTGIKALDDFLERLSYEAQATAYGALRLVCVSDATGNKMRDYLRRQVALLDDPKQVDDLLMDGQVLADIKWFLGFVRGAEIGLEEC